MPSDAIASIQPVILVVVQTVLEGGPLPLLPVHLLQLQVVPAELRLITAAVGHLVTAVFAVSQPVGGVAVRKMGREPKFYFNS